MNLIGQKGSNNYINALKQVVGATFAEAEDYAGHFTDRYSYQSAEVSLKHPFEQQHVLGNDVVVEHIGFPNAPSQTAPILPQVEFLWGRLYYNKGLTAGDPATYTIDGDQFALSDNAKYRLFNTGYYLFPEGTEIDVQGVLGSYTDLVAMSDLRKWILIYIPDDLENPAVWDSPVAIPFDGYFYYGILQPQTSSQESSVNTQTILFKPDGSFTYQYLHGRVASSLMMTSQAQDCFFTHIANDLVQTVSDFADYYFEGKRLRIPMSVLGLDHTPTPIEFINIPD